MNNEPVAWMELYFGEPNNIAWTNAELKDSGDVYKTIPLYTHPAKTQELLKEIQELKEKLMMEEESYILLDEELLCAKEAIKQQQVKIEVLKAKTLTDEEIVNLYKETEADNGGIREFARAILRKAQEK